MKNLVLLGRRWFERTNGNTYHAAIAHADGKEAAKIDFRYGYGNQWEWEITNELEKAGLLPDREHFKNGGAEGIYRYCERKGITLVSSYTDVHRKKDLAF